MFEPERIIKKYELDLLFHLIGNCENKIIKALEYNNTKENVDFRNYLLYTVGKCFVTCREIILLCKSGYPDGALALARNIYEQFVITFYLKDQVINRNNMDIMNKYFDDYDYQRANNLKFEAKRIKEDVSEEEKYNEIICNLCDKYGLKRINSSYWWIDEKDKKFASLCEYVCNNNPSMILFLRTMQLLYKRACLSVHASYMGNRIRIGSDFNGIDVGPWEKGQESALFLSVSSMIYILGIVSDFMNVSFEKELKALNKLAMKYMGQIKGEASQI